MKTIITVAALFVAFISTAQKTETHSPKVAVETYFDGYKKGDTTILKKVFHPSFHLSWLSPWAKGDQAFKQVDRSGMFAFFGPNWKNNKINCRIIDTQQQASMAWVKARVEIEGIVIWTDYINLLKIGRQWWIVSKVSVGKI